MPDGSIYILLIFRRKINFAEINGVILTGFVMMKYKNWMENFDAV